MDTVTLGTDVRPIGDPRAAQGDQGLHELAQALFAEAPAGEARRDPGFGEGYGGFPRMRATAATCLGSLSGQGMRPAGAGAPPGAADSFPAFPSAGSARA